jgi:CubicO group peptidase (beta-lactamase class C family)
MAAPIESLLLDELEERVAEVVRTCGLPAAQFALAQSGTVLRTRSFGTAQDGTRFVLQSAGRPVLAAAVWRLMAEAGLDVTRTVASYIPEFGETGKGGITIEQLMTHVAGFPLAPLKHPAMLSRAARLEAFRTWRLTYEPGTQLQFHLTSAAWVLAELVERLTGMTYPEYLRHAVSEPLGLASLDVGVSVERQSDIAPMTLVGPPSPDGGVDPWGPWYLSKPEVLAAGEPSHSTVSTASDLAMLYQGVAGSGLWPAELVADVTRVRVTLPVEGLRGNTASVPGNVALFVLVSGDDGQSRGFLPRTGSPAIWGHGGAACQLGFYDPSSSVSFAFLTNGYPASGYAVTEDGLPITMALADFVGEMGARACR